MFFSKFKKRSKSSVCSFKEMEEDNSLNNKSFWNHTFDKGRIKSFVLWFLKNHGEHKTVRLVEELKNIGFQYSTKAGISLGIEDLKIPEKKYSLIMDAEQLSIATIRQYKRSEITGVERFQRLIDTWHRTSENLKQEVIDNFEATDVLNPVYMMAFSGARGNISQVRQLVGMRGLMSDPQGQIIDFPIRSNFREGLTLTEYIISSYGARKGIVDTALRTANAGYLTRRLVDVAQHVIISSFNCGTKRGIFLTDMKEGNKIIYSLQNRLLGRVLARDVYDNKKNKIASRNCEVSIDLANNLTSHYQKVFVRSALTCSTKKLVCQLCYGWSLAHGNLVPIGEAVGVVAAQSIGEPGTQLTMRTFHTGGVFSGDVSDQIRSPFNGIVEYDSPIAGTLIRTPEGKIAFLTKNEGSFMVHRAIDGKVVEPKETKRFKIPFYTLLFLKNGSISHEKEVIAQISSINRQKNATDQVELTIKSELSGQFYSKFLDLKENKVGPKLKSTENSNNTVNEQFNENAVDTIFEAWGWGYAWVLSGKVYQIGLPSLIFPIIGDFVNKKTYMNQVKWNLPTSFGSSFKLNPPKQKSLFNHSSKKPIRQFLSQDLPNSTLLRNKQLVLLKSQLISLQLSKIVYKDIGYFLRLASPLSSFNPTVRSFNTQLNDTLFLFCSLFSNTFTDEALTKIKPKNEISVYPTDWQPTFDVFLKWFPKRFATKTAGLILIQPNNSKSQGKALGGFLKKSIEKKNLLKSGRINHQKPRITKNFSRSVSLINEFQIDSKKHNKLNFIINKKLNSKVIHLSEQPYFNSELKSESSILNPTINQIHFFPTFIRRHKLKEIQNQSNTLNQITTNVNFEAQKKDTIFFKDSEFKTFKNVSDLSQTLISEQYLKSQSSKNIKPAKNKPKVDTSSFNLMWQNALKINLNGYSHLKFNKSKLSSQAFSNKNLNKKIFQDFGKFFWVSQPFYKISLQKLKMIILDNENDLNLKKHLSNSFYFFNNENEEIRQKSIFYQINRQGRFKPFCFEESVIQIDQNLTNDSIKNSQGFSKLSQLNIGQLYQKFPSISFIEDQGLNKSSNSKFISFNLTLNKDLKLRKKYIFSFIDNNYGSKKQSNSKNLTLKSFSKISSIPYFLNNKSSILFRNYFLKRNNTKRVTVKNSIGNFSLFYIYFYSLFNKHWKNISTQEQENASKDINSLKFKQICSLYFKDQLIFYNFSDEKFNPLTSKKKNLVLLHNINSERQKSKFLYNQNLNSLCYILSSSGTLNQNINKFKLLQYKTIFHEMVEQRVYDLINWFKFSNQSKKFYLKKLLKLNKQVYYKFFKFDPFYADKKPHFLNQNRKIRSVLNKKTPLIKKTYKKETTAINLLFKTGWVYLTKNLCDFSFLHKRLLNPGKKLKKDLIFPGESIYIEIISLKTIPSYMVLINHFFNTKFDSKNPNYNFQNINFKLTIINKSCRFQPKTDEFVHNSYFLFIQKASEYKLISKISQKKYLNTFSNQLSIAPCLYNLNEFLHNKNLSQNIPVNKVINKSFNTLNAYFQYKTPLLNKQQITSQTISKWPSGELKLISNNHFFNSFIDSNFSHIKNSENQIVKLSRDQIAGFSYFELKSLKPLNFLSITLSYSVPYSFHFPFKTPLHIFSDQQDKFLFTQKLDSKTNSNSNIKSILYHYIFKINQIKLKSKQLTTLKLNKTSKFSLTHFNRNLSSIFCCPIAEYSLGSPFEKSISVPNFLLNSNKNPFQNLIWNLNNVKNERSFKIKNQKILGSLKKEVEFTNQIFNNKEISLYKTDFSTFSDYSITPQVSLFKTSSYCSFEGELIYKTEKAQKLSNFSPAKLSFDKNSLFDAKNIDYGCMVLTKSDQISFYFSSENYKDAYYSLENLRHKSQYKINDIIINFLNVSEQNQKDNQSQEASDSGVKSSANSLVVQINKLPAGMSQQKSKLLLGEFLVYGDQISPNSAIPHSGHIIHINNQKVTLRRGQPLLVSPKSVLHKYDGDFIDPQSPVITLSYQQLKTGDIIQGIPKVEQFFEARTTKRGRLFRDSLSNLLKGLFKRYRAKLPFDQAVRQSFYKIQQIIVDGVQRVYRSQGVSISDKHLEIIVKQMTSKVRIIEGGQTGFFPGEIVDLDFVEYVNSLLIKKIIYEPLVLGITKSSLEVDSFLSAASFQQTTRVLSQAAISRKKDFLKGLKENVILGNLIPAGTGYLVYLDT